MIQAYRQIVGFQEIYLVSDKFRQRMKNDLLWFFDCKQKHTANMNLLLEKMKKHGARQWKRT